MACPVPPPADAPAPSRSPEEHAAEALLEQLLSRGLLRGRSTRRAELLAVVAQAFHAATEQGRLLERRLLEAIVRDEEAQMPQHEVYMPVRGVLVRVLDRLRAGKG